MFERSRAFAGSGKAPVNIALAKYWGKRDSDRNLPAVPSLSVSLADFFIQATVTFKTDLRADMVIINGEPSTASELSRMSRFVDHFRQLASRTEFAEIASFANFPRSAGLASSAAAFAAVAMAVNDALGLALSARDLSRMSRLGSGSAARSLFRGYVELPLDPKDNDAADVLKPAEHLPLDVVVAITDPSVKAISSTDAMNRCAATSPCYSSWVDSAPGDFEAIKTAVLKRDFGRLAEYVELNAMKMHTTAITAQPVIRYFNEMTLELIRRIGRLREDGLRTFFTVDAGPNVVVFVEPAHRTAVISGLDGLPVDLRLTRVG